MRRMKGEARLEIHRVVHLIKGVGRGGAEMLLPAGLRVGGQGFEYAYGYFLPWKDALVDDLRSLDAPVTCFGGRSNAAILLKARRVAKELTRWRADVLHCHLPVAGIVGRIAGRMAGVPVVYTEHNKMERYHGLTRRANLLTWRWQQHAIAVSESVAESIRGHVSSGVATKVPLTTVENGVDTEQFDPAPGGGADGAAVRQQFGIPADAPVVGTVAVFRVQKRLDHWLQAAARVVRSVPEAHFLLVGDGPLRADVERWIEAEGLGGRVHLAGLQTEVRPYLAAMDAYLMSSQFEGLPIALLEAMAMARPVVATAVGGIPEVIANGQNGLLVPAGDPMALGDAVVRVLGDAAMRQSFAEAARATVCERFSIARMQRQLEDIYRQVIAEHRGKT